MTTRPRSLNRTSLPRMRWVPMTRSTEPLGQPVEHRLGLAVGLEAGQCLHDDREPGVPLGEGVGVLLDEQGGRAQDRDLLAVLDRLERGAHRDLGLAVADVAADQPVHGHGPLHVDLDLVDGAQLVGRLDVREGVLELALPRGVGREGVAAGRHPRGVQADQLGGDLLDVAPGTALGLVPVGAAHPVQARLLAPDVARDLVELVGGDVEPVAGLPPLGRARTRARGTRASLRRRCAASSRRTGRHRAARGRRSRRAAAGGGRPGCGAATASAACPWSTCPSPRRTR